MIVVFIILFGLMLEDARPRDRKGAQYVAWVIVTGIVALALLSLYALQEGFIP